jgi:hypothetical protein
LKPPTNQQESKDEPIGICCRTEEWEEEWEQEWEEEWEEANKHPHLHHALLQWTRPSSTASHSRCK